jgi:hypothetical protein
VLDAKWTFGADCIYYGSVHTKSQDGGGIAARLGLVQDAGRASTTWVVQREGTKYMIFVGIPDLVGHRD